MVNAISNHVSSFPAAPFSWGTARKVKTELQSEVARNGADNPIALLKYVSNIQDFFSGMRGQQRQSSGEVSNLGVWRSHSSLKSAAAEDVDERSDGKWSCGRMTFSQSTNQAGAPICLSAVTGADGCLVLSFSWADEDAVVEEGLGRVPNAVREGLEELLH